jgi:hypothetical protein
MNATCTQSKALLGPNWKGGQSRRAVTTKQRLLDNDLISRSAPLLVGQLNTPSTTSTPAPPTPKLRSKCCVWSELITSEDWLSCWTAASLVTISIIDEC